MATDFEASLDAAKQVIEMTESFMQSISNNCWSNMKALNYRENESNGVRKDEFGGELLFSRIWNQSGSGTEPVKEKPAVANTDVKVAPEYSRKITTSSVEIGDDDVSVNLERIKTEINREDDGTESFRSKDGFLYKKEKDGSICVKDPQGTEFKVSPTNELTVTYKDGTIKTYKPSKVLTFRDGGSQDFSYPEEAQFALFRGIRGDIRVNTGIGTTNQHRLETSKLSGGAQSEYSIITPRKK